MDPFLIYTFFFYQVPKSQRAPTKHMNAQDLKVSKNQLAASEFVNYLRAVIYYFCYKNTILLVFGVEIKLLVFLKLT